mgnify:FL=1|tara:strand:+ start:262 stop:1236 length:975 start_codon:yes stop_codon:yes gene_type:complete
MNKIQELWADDFGYALQVKILNPICSERFNDVIEYLNEYEIHPDATRQLLYIQDKYIFVFFSDLPSSDEVFLSKIKNHFRTCKNGIRNEDYSVELKPTEEVSKTFNGWLLKLIVKLKENELLLTKSSVISKDYIYDFNRENRDKIGKLKIEKKIEKIENEIEKKIEKIDIMENELTETIENNCKIIENNLQIDEQSRELDQRLIDATKRVNDLSKKENECEIKIQEAKEQCKNEKEIGQKKLQELKQKEEMTYKTIINNLFTITNNKRDFVSKRLFCDILNLDIDNKSDIRLLSTILKNESVEYNRKKTIKGIAGAYSGIKLNE